LVKDFRMPFAAVDTVDLSAVLRRGDTVVCGQGLAEPVGLTRKLIEQRAELSGLGIFLGPTFADTFDAAHADHLRLRSWCATGRNARLCAAGALDIVPAHYAELPTLFASGALRCDVALLTLCGPDSDGRYNLALACDYLIEAARRARVVIAEVHADLPWVHGAELPVDIRPHLLVHAAQPALEMSNVDAATSEEEFAIARRVAGLIPDGATLALGVGRLPDRVLAQLNGHRDLGVHSAVLTDQVVGLIEEGAVTNARKPFDRGVSVGGLLMGRRRLFDFAHRNPRVRLAPPAHTHSIDRLGALPALVALTGALEVDLTGQVNAETAQGRYVGAVGGQLAFVRGARASAGGLAVTMLPATARDGTLSRIVARLPDGVVTTPRADVDRVVTEFGVAELRGKSIAERIDAMLAIAHPEHRAALAQQGAAVAGRRA
jgi:acyl-CoA hydrolase